MAKFIEEIHILLCAAILTGCPVELVLSDGNLMVQFVQFQSNGCLATGQLCDPPTSFGAYNPCDPLFRVTADRFSSTGSGLYSYSQSPDYYRDQDNITFSTYFGYIYNPISIISSSSWVSASQNTLWLAVEVYDLNLTVSNLNLMSSFSTQLTISNGSQTSLVLISSNGHRLWLKYWFTCNTNYYGQYCSNYCYTSNGWCDSLGQKTCYYGWIDASTDCVKKHPCRTCSCWNGGSCIPQGTENYTCLCTFGYTGRNCETCSLVGSNSTVIGSNSTVIGSNSTVIGSNSTVIGSNSTVIGSNSTVGCAYYDLSYRTCDLCSNCQLASSSYLSSSSNSSCAASSADDSAFNAGVAIGVLLVVGLTVGVILCYCGYCRCCFKCC